MGAFFDDPACIENQDPVDLTNSRKTMGDDDRGSAFAQDSQGLLDQVFRQGIETRGRLVEHEDRFVGKNRSRDGDSLALTAREFDASFADEGLISLIELRDELVGMRAACGLADLVERRGGAAVGDIIGERTTKENRLLGHDRDHRPPVRGEYTPIGI